MIAEEPPLIGLVTIWYRASRDIDRFVAGFTAHRYPRLQPVFVIHCQTGDEITYLCEEVPSALILRPGVNLGTAAGWNMGIARLLDCDAEYIGMLNVDVKLDPDCIVRLVETMERDPTIGACQPLLLYSDEPNKVQMYGGSMDARTGRAWHDYNGVSELSKLPPLRDASYLDGGTMLVRADVLRQVGGFDEKYFLYWEDTDLSVRIQRAGYRTVAVRDARAWHYHRENRAGFPTALQLYYETRNRFYFVRKHAGRLAAARLAASMLPGTPRQLVHFLGRGRPVLAAAYLSGFVCGVVGCTGRQWSEATVERTSTRGRGRA